MSWIRTHNPVSPSKQDDKTLIEIRVGKTTFFKFYEDKSDSEKELVLFNKKWVWVS